VAFDIDPHAPAAAAAEETIQAPLEVVWTTLSDLADWPRWNEAVGSMQAPSSLRPGATFRWEAGGMRISSRLEDVAAPARIAWSGRTFGVKARHVWELEARDGATLVRTRESFGGWLPWLFRAPLRGMLERALRQGLAALRSEAERAAAP